MKAFTEATPSTGAPQRRLPLDLPPWDKKLNGNIIFADAAWNHLTNKACVGWIVFENGYPSQTAALWLVPSLSAEVSETKAILMALQHCSIYEYISKVLSDALLVVQAIATHSSSDVNTDPILHDIQCILQDPPH
ncbi:hypothetical protein Syun_012548 [Stephania yunnanensis]|uniref:RNase H type-1 domain-containing protein n=1 Tax=Stephania yunnanensis TaxID=152371 RepID=A0AAP0K107_9MAGN